MADRSHPTQSGCPCGRFPDPGIKPGGGCWCTEEDTADRKEIVADIVAAAFHDHYERLAPQFGYKTMRATVQSLIDANLIHIPGAGRMERRQW